MSRGQPKTFSEKVELGRRRISELMGKIASQRKYIAALEVEQKDARPARRSLKEMLVVLEEMLAEQHQIMMEEMKERETTEA